MDRRQYGPVDPGTVLSAVRFLVDTLKTLADTSQVVKGVEASFDKPERQRMSLIYWEVVYNAIGLTVGQSLRPPALLVTRHEWDQVSRPADLAALLPGPEIAYVVVPYLELDNYQQMFNRPMLEMFRDRLTGDDQFAMQRLAASFRLAEETLRKALFSKTQQDRLAEAFEAGGFNDSPQKRGAIDRATAAIAALPLWVPDCAVGGVHVLGRT